MTEHRNQLLGDAVYFATQLNRCIESLESIEPDGHMQTHWQQAAATTKSIKRYVIEEIKHRRKIEERKRRAAAMRAASR